MVSDFVVISFSQTRQYAHNAGEGNIRIPGVPYSYSRASGTCLLCSAWTSQTVIWDADLALFVGLGLASGDIVSLEKQLGDEIEFIETCPALKWDEEWQSSHPDVLPSQ